jgi:hypothetical protein
MGHNMPTFKGKGSDGLFITTKAFGPYDVFAYIPHPAFCTNLFTYLIPRTPYLVFFDDVLIVFIEIIVAFNNG